MQKYANSVQDPLGNAIGIATVSIYTDAAHTTLATLYLDNGVTPVANPLTTNSLGEFSFYAADGRYYIVVSKTGITSQSLDDVILFDSTAATSAASINVTQSGSGSSVTPTTRTTEQELRETISPLQWSSASRVEGTTDDSAAILQASKAAVAQGKDVDFGGHTWLVGTAITFALNGLSWRLRGATIKKGFSGDMFTGSSLSDFSVDGVGIIDGGSDSGFTGRSFVFSGTGLRTHFMPGISFRSSAGAHIEFGADAGQEACVYCEFRPNNLSTEYIGVKCTGPDTLATNRKIIGSIATGGYHSLTGTMDTHIIGGSCKRVEVDSTSSLTSIIGMRWGNAGVSMSVSGANTDIIGCQFSGSLTLDSNWSGQFIGNQFTSGSLTNSASGVNGIVHKSSSTYTIGNATFNATLASRFLTGNVTAAGDQDQTLSVTANGPTLRYNSTLGANRTVTLSTTGAVKGDILTVSRTGGNSGGPWTVDVGGLKSLTQNQWVDVQYDGSAWFELKFGSL